MGDVAADDVDRSENTFLQLMSSLKSNKQILRKIMKSDERTEAKKPRLEVEEEEGGITALEVEEGEEEEESSDDEGGSGESDEESESEEEEEEEDSDDEAKPSLNGTTQLDPFKVHFEQDIEESTVDQFDKCKFERVGDKTSLNQATSVEHFSYPSTTTQQLTSHLTNLAEGTEEETELFNHAAVKDSLRTNWKELEKSKKVWANQMHNSLFRAMTSYKDVFHLTSSYEYWDKVRHVYTLHVVNHVLKSRARILKNNARLSQAQKQGTDIGECRDQGLTRPKVLIILPYKNFCLQIVNDIIKLLFAPGSKAQVMQKKRFMAEFSPDPDEKESKLERPDDYKATFAGNIDDCFRVGLSFSKNTLKLYAEFYAADVIIASPLGLRTIIGGEGEKQDFDFLSSIEMLILDQTDVFLMQNWEHLTHILEHMNLKPQQSHGTDYSRVRMSTVSGHAKYYRQTMVFSSTLSPEMNGLFNKFCFNFNGKVRYTNTNTSGSISQIASQISQVFHRVPSMTFAEDADARFNYFIKKIIPEFQSNLFAGTAVFIPSYFDFVRVRNHFKKEKKNFVQISEYSKRSNITRSRAMFLDGSKHYLLFTERFNFFYRYKLKGIRHIIFYQLPHFPHFYSEIVNAMTTSEVVGDSSVSCTVLYSRFDGFRLESVVGGARCKQLLGSSKDTHMLVTG